MGELIWEANALRSCSASSDWDAMEAMALLRKILCGIDVAMFGFDGAGRLQLVNDSGNACSAARMRNSWVARHKSWV